MIHAFMRISGIVEQSHDAAQKITTVALSTKMMHLNFLFTVNSYLHKELTLIHRSY